MRDRLKRPTFATFTPAFYWSCTYLLRFLLTIFVRWRVRGRANVPATGALVVVSNHVSNTDPPVLGAGIGSRRIRYMAKIELFSYPGGVIPRLWGAFPVRRFEADMAALLNAERLLKRGEVLGMFPEGTRSRGGGMGKPHPGTALIALRSGAPVLPCAVIGTEQLTSPFRILRRPPVAVLIGKPITVTQVRRPSEAQITELTAQMVAAIGALIPPAYRAAYTGDDGGNSPGV